MLIEADVIKQKRFDSYHFWIGTIVINHSCIRCFIFDEYNYIIKGNRLVVRRFIEGIYNVSLSNRS